MLSPFSFKRSLLKANPKILTAAPKRMRARQRILAGDGFQLRQSRPSPSLPFPGRQAERHGKRRPAGRGPAPVPGDASRLLPAFLLQRTRQAPAVNLLDASLDCRGHAGAGDSGIGSAAGVMPDAPWRSLTKRLNGSASGIILLGLLPGGPLTPSLDI